MIYLRNKPRVSDLRAFSVALGALLGMGVLLGGWATGWSRAAGAAPLSALVVFAAGWRAPGVTRWLYMRWDQLARAVSRRSALWVTRMAFLVFTISARAGSRFPVSPPSPEASGWLAREPSADREAASQSRYARDDANASTWLLPLLGWAKASSNSWVWAVAPFLVLLSLLRDVPKSVVSDKNYGLY